MSDIRHLEGTLDAAGLRIAVVAARFNETIVRQLVDGATGALLRHGARAEDLSVVWVPGAWELPVVLDRLAASGEVDALVALGCVVRGETTHFDYVAGEGSNGTAAVARTHGIAIGNAVLTTEDWDQAVARAGGKLGNKGAEAALAAVETATLLRSL
ncbi:MAG: 6,7-dimethyl-8-ribityllumazine synthase [Nitriliruptor sp.]|nr:MAG: 6,7-dimethyl-8-ribityllumazine synthase [Nitriliruptor sp.]TVR25090.1 MAG: 6,7-dimethyl-8-ribityllumazine synthase [Nitriliruptor sp.]